METAEDSLSRFLRGFRGVNSSEEDKGTEGKPPLQLCPPGDCCKIPNCLMADAQSVLRAQAGAAANKSLGAAAARAGEGLGARCQAPAPAGSSLAPSEPVLASPQHLGREVIDQGWWALSSESCPGPRDPSEMHSWGSTGTQGTDRIGHPNFRPLRPSEKRPRQKQIALLLFFVCPPWLELPPHPA